MIIIETINCCCFFGHRKINVTNNLKEKLYKIIKELIVIKKVNTFLFGSNSQFDDLCYEIVSQIKKDYPNIRRVYVRAEFPYIKEDYIKYLLQYYEETYFPENIINSGKSVYIQRNYEMINKSKICVVYYDERYIISNNYHSGTKIAYNYAKKKGKIIYNMCSI